jgi:hypothetical protein
MKGNILAEDAEKYLFQTKNKGKRYIAVLE